MWMSICSSTICGNVNLFSVVLSLLLCQKRSVGYYLFGSISRLPILFHSTICIFCYYPNGLMIIALRYYSFFTVSQNLQHAKVSPETYKMLSFFFFNWGGKKIQSDLEKSCRRDTKFQFTQNLEFTYFVQQLFSNNLILTDWKDQI